MAALYVDMATSLIMKLFANTPAKSPIRSIADYAPEEVARYQESYRLLVAEYRRHERINFGVVALMMGVIGVLLLLRPPFWISLATIGLLLVLGTLYLLWALPQSRVPQCPACGNQPGMPFGSFCPECGSKTLESAKHPWRGQVPYCRSCNRRMHSGEGGRSYRIRVCSHCGLMLDEKGL